MITYLLYNMLVINNPHDRKLDATFFALSDRTRRGILVRLASGQATVNELTEAFDISQPAISRHLKVLESAGLIERSRDAQRRPARVELRPIGDVMTWMQRYRDLWEQNYRRLDALLAGEIETRKKSKKRKN
jgi:DNA-binding transcriptional ArsR family regulator